MSKKTKRVALTEIPEYKVKYSRKDKLWCVIFNKELHYIHKRAAGSKNMYYVNKRYYYTLRDSIFAVLLEL